MTPFTCDAHHVRMQHVEDNGREDLSSATLLSSTTLVKCRHNPRCWGQSSKTR